MAVDPYMQLPDDFCRGAMKRNGTVTMPSETFDGDKSTDEACDYCASAATIDVFANHFNPSIVFAPGGILRVCDSHAQQFHVGQRFYMYKNTLQTGRIGRLRGNYIVKAVARIGEEPDFGSPVPHIPTRAEQYEAHYGHPKGSR